MKCEGLKIEKQYVFENQIKIFLNQQIKAQALNLIRLILIKAKIHIEIIYHLLSYYLLK